MWTRALLKENAKRALQGRYWRGFAVCLILSLLEYAYLWIASFLCLFFVMLFLGVGLGADFLASFSLFSPDSVVSLLLIVYGVILAVLLLWAGFFAGALKAGNCRYFMESRQSPAPMGTLFSTFRKPYWNVAKVYFLTSLKILGIMLLCLIPGGILSVILLPPPLAVIACLLLTLPGLYFDYCYALVAFLLAENPYLTTRRAMELSKQMMYGEKWRYFVLQLSFFGWYLLCAAVYGILLYVLPFPLSALSSFGILFLAPYLNATYAEFYAAMRAKAFSQGLSTTEELGGFVRHDNSTAAR